MTAAGFNIPSQFVRSAIWAALAALCFAIMVTSVRYMEGKFDAFEIVFVRALVGLLIIMPLIFRSGLGALRTTKLPLHIVRTLFAVLGMATLYYAVALMPVAEVIDTWTWIGAVIIFAAGYYITRREAQTRAA